MLGLPVLSGAEGSKRENPFSALLGQDDSVVPPSSEATRERGDQKNPASLRAIGTADPGAVDVSDLFVTRHTLFTSHLSSSSVFLGSSPWPST